MIGSKFIVKRGRREEAEKPFWISFADLMSALVVLFLVVMGVALLSVTQTVTEIQSVEDIHKEKIQTILDHFEAASASYEGITIHRDRHAIDFGARAQFAFGTWQLSAEQESVLRQFVPEILKIANDELGKDILKRVVIEGYTDKTGSYLTNLNLSLQRSQKVLCSMFATSGPNLLDDSQKADVRNLFFVGGYSFNAAKESDEESRRVEMRLEFRGINEEPRSTPTYIDDNFGECALR